ncbi:MAG: DNA polymerase III subunit gamma/tau [Chitinispirillaceae bacterium]|nr:DNA polymerase III subunit gamma/tau [Chitinispirillaceae bacterium]
MSYLVFARKWRPPTFDDVVGQEHITETLKKAIEKNRVAHAYIFTGTRGVGKTTTARILAKALNCEKGPTPTPCGECLSCKDIVTGSSFDVLEIDGASNNSVNDIRELRENVGYSSMGGKHRIFVIDEVHMLSNSAFNALLKTLEEPPENVIFIFATTEPQKIPATIHSRCQRYDFRRISADHILERLVHICDREHISYEKAALMLVARKADGSMRDALSLLDQVYSFCQENLSEKEVRSVLGLVGLEVYDRVMDAVLDKDGAVMLGVVQEVLYQGFDLQEFIVGLQEHLRNLLFARIPGALTGRGIDLDEETARRFTASAERFTEADLLRMAEMVKRTEYDLKRSAFPRFQTELMLLKLVHLDSTVSIEQMVKMLGGNVADDALSLPATNPDAVMQTVVKKKLNIDSVSAPEPQERASLPDDGPAEEVPPPYDAVPPGFNESGSVQEVPVSETTAEPSSSENDTTSFEYSLKPGEVPDIQQLWPLFLETMLRDRPKLGSFLSLATVAGHSSRTIDLRFAQAFNFQFQEVNKKSNREEITNILHTLTGNSFEIRMTLETESTGEPQQNYFKPAGIVPVSINDEIEQEPIIQTVLDMFDGEVIE